MAKKEKTECKDKKCPIHGNVGPRGRGFAGVVVSVNPHKTAVVEWEMWGFVQKYERYKKKKTRISVHNPQCIDAKKGDRVAIRECRPLSKTKKFVITKIIGKEELFAEKERLLEESKVKSPKEIEEEKKAAKKEGKESAGEEKEAKK